MFCGASPSCLLVHTVSSVPGFERTHRTQDDHVRALRSSERARRNLTLSTLHAVQVSQDSDVNLSPRAHNAA